ncbi:MAG: hypothetical protein ACR2GD_13955 [Pyrinomonadaceae bacterium]
MFEKSFAVSKGWLAFELNILRRLKFKIAALPTGGEKNLGAQLKRWNVRVLTNDFLQSEQWSAIAEIENNDFTLDEKDISAALENVYVPRHRLKNLSLRNWFGETEAGWFDNVRKNIEKLKSATTKAAALKIGMSVGDYVLSFTDETRKLRQPLSEIFRRLCSIEPKLFDNHQNNLCANKKLKDFIAENYADLIFLRLPAPRRTTIKNALGAAAWREEWIRGADDFWRETEALQSVGFGARVETKTQYLQFVENVLQIASHIPQWAIAHVEDNFLTTQDVVETINRVRRVETIFTKDFSELTGTKAVIITA